MPDTETSQLACADTQTHVFQAEKRHVTIAFVKKCAAELVRRRGVATLLFRSEKRHTPFIFLTKSIADHTLSAQNRRMRRPFLYKTEVCGALHLSGTSQARDLAKVDDFERLSL